MMRLSQEHLSNVECFLGNTAASMDRSQHNVRRHDGAKVPVHFVVPLGSAVNPYKSAVLDGFCNDRVDEELRQSDQIVGHGTLPLSVINALSAVPYKHYFHDSIPHCEVFACDGSITCEVTP